MDWSTVFAVALGVMAGMLGWHLLMKVLK